MCPHAWQVVVNYCARCTLKGSGLMCLGIVTICNVAVGFTPYVDNFMHLGGLVAGLVFGAAVFARKTDRDPRTGRRVRTSGQEIVTLLATMLLFVLAVGAVGGVLSSDLKALLRTCPFCRHINCLEIGELWSCCSTMALQGTCLGLQPPPNASAPIYAHCNMTHAPAPFVTSCSPQDDAGCVWPADMTESDPRIGALCSLICGGGC